MDHRLLVSETASPHGSLLESWHVLVERRLLIVSLCVLSTLAALIVSLLLPKVYQSTSTLLPQVDTKDLGGLATLLAASEPGRMAQGLGLSLPGASATPTDVFVAILKSRIMADDIIRRFNLTEVYGENTLQDTRKELADDTSITVSKEKVIKVMVEAGTPQLAADIANFYVTNLDTLNRTLNVSKAGQQRAFIERRLAETQDHLAKAEEALKEFQTHNKTVAVEAQSKAMIEAAATIQGQITAHEVQLQVMSTYLSADNPELARVKSGIDELRKQLYLLESGKSGKGMIPGDRLHPAMVTIPSLALEYARRMRDVKVQETLFTLLTSQHEQAKLAEARDTPTVQILDSAVPAEKKTRPRIALNTFIGGLLGLWGGILLAFVLRYVDRAERARPPGGGPQAGSAAAR